MRRKNGEMLDVWWRGTRRGMDWGKLWIGVWMRENERGEGILGG